MTKRAIHWQATLAAVVICGGFCAANLLAEQGSDASTVPLGRSISEFLTPDGRFDLEAARLSGLEGSLVPDESGIQFDTGTDAPKDRLSSAKTTSASPNGFLWSALGSGTNGPVYALAVYGNKLIAGGSFTTAGGVSANNIAAWDGTSWSALGSGTNGAVRAMAVYNNSLIVGGHFTTAGGGSSYFIAAWNGSSWSALGYGRDDYVYSLAVYGNKLIAGGEFWEDGPRVAAWDGSSWSALGSGMYYAVLSLAVYGDKLIAGGEFWPDHHIVAWDGSSWSTMGEGFDSQVYALAVYNGWLIAGGRFLQSGSERVDGIAVWNDYYGSWFGLGGGTDDCVRTFTTYDDKLIAGGRFDFIHHGFAVAKNIIAYGEGGWSPMGSGMGGYPYSVMALTVYGNKLIAGGDFTTAGGVSVNRIAACEIVPLAPIAYIDNIEPNPALVGASIVFTGHGTDQDGTIIGYEWRSSIDGSLSNQASFSMSSLAEGTHTIYFKVQDNDGTWSPEASETLTVSHKHFIIRDATPAKNPIPNTEFDFIKVSPPQMSEQSMGKATTDAEGKVQLPADWFAVGNLIKVQRLVYTHPARKHTTIMPTMYNAYLDNGSLDPTSGDVLSPAVSSDPTQDITLNHTTLRYNLLVSIEWDAEVDYINSVKEGLQLASYYLSDISDAQIELDTVMITDDMTNWNNCDIRVMATNVPLPESNVAWQWPEQLTRSTGIFSAGSESIRFPRFYCHGNAAFSISDIDLSWYWELYDWGVNHPPYLTKVDGWKTNDGITYPTPRTIGHEFGHYALGFYDEYCDFLCFNKSYLLDYNFGMMDTQTDAACDQASELSSSIQYEEHQGTDQWMTRGFMSCWDWFEHKFEKVYGGIWCPIVKPTERGLTVSAANCEVAVAGPNDDPEYPNYSLPVTFLPTVVDPPSARTVPAETYRVGPSGEEIAVPYVEVWMERAGQGSSTAKKIIQGKSCDIGKIKVLGYETGYSLDAAGEVEVRLLDAKSTRKYASEKVWMCGSNSGASTSSVRNTTSQSLLNADDTIAIVMHPVEGNYRALCSTSCTPSSSVFSLAVENPFPDDPTLIVYPDTGNAFPVDPQVSGNIYQVEVDQRFGRSGSVTIKAPDDSQSSFFFDLHYGLYDSSSLSMNVAGPTSRSELTLDPTNSTLSSVLMVSTAYTPLMTGLQDGSVKAGEIQSLSFYPQSDLIGDNYITIRYLENDLGDSAAAHELESQLRIFQWSNEEHSWNIVGGEVGTSSNHVTAAITEGGIYGAFTYYQPSSCCTGRVGDANGLGDYPDEITLGDIMMMIDAKFISMNCNRLLCLTEADVNQDGGSEPTCDDITLIDIMTLVDLLFIHPETAVLPDCL